MGLLDDLTRRLKLYFGKSQELIKEKSQVSMLMGTIFFQEVKKEQLEYGEEQIGNC